MLGIYKPNAGDKIAGECDNNTYGLRHDRHTVALLSDHLVITSKYRGKILVSEVALETGRVTGQICESWTAR